MRKDILTEINVYHTVLSPQRGYNIDNKKIKAEAVKGYVLSAKRMEEKIVGNIKIINLFLLAQN